MTSYSPEYLKKLELKSIEEHNKSRFTFLDRIGTGVACPNCGKELIESQPGVILTSYPPQKLVHCESCDYKNCILA